MKLSIGIVGLPNVGKSTLFKALTKQEVNIANYPFATIDPNVGVVPVPDERLEQLTKLSTSKKTIPAVVEFYDIAGLVKGANKGEGLGNQFLAHIRETQAIVIVLRIFQNADIIHVENSVDPIRDLGIITTELALKDLETVGKYLKKLEGEARTGKKEALQDLEAFREIEKRLASGTPLIGWDAYSNVLENIRISALNLLTGKRQIYLLNGDEADMPGNLTEKIREMGGEYIVANLAAAEGVPELIRKAYEILGLISFFTTGEDETRAWTIERGTKAPQAAGVIHTDFEKNFIRAEVIAYSKLLMAGSWNAAKQKGWIRLEGKEYVIADGDVIVVRHG
ncbi:MAG: redox-regulated ATPase YchF [Candidatus Liptonbacteria bacterium]|nr:redox-regulated ATPase YchF [Candidatus Liptonbacteria bacterium]